MPGSITGAYNKGKLNLTDKLIAVETGGHTSVSYTHLDVYKRQDLPLELDTDGDGIPDYLDLDSDNDGCLDALEGGDNVITSQLVSASVGLSVGTGSSASNQNLCADGSCVDAQGVPTVVNAGGAADIDGAQGQSIGSSKDETCLLYTSRCV